MTLEDIFLKCDNPITLIESFITIIDPYSMTFVYKELKDLKF